MSNPTVEQLLAWMNGKSRTQGWSAIVAYDRGKANDLLTQLFIERFNSASYLPPLSESLDHGDSTNVEHVYDLTFAVPQLHFETADLDESRVELSLDFIGGMIVSEFIPAQGFPRIDKLQKVLPLNRPQLTMSVLLGNGEGQVGHEGEVTLDISEGTRFSANFVVGTLSQEEIGSRFKLFFENELDDTQKIYPLGKLDGENGVLTPERFDIRTMPAPGATRRDAENYRDGAIILFVKLKGGTAGGLPGSGSDFMYPIPADAGSKHYSGSLLLSSYTLIEKVLRGYIQTDIGNGIAFKPWQGSHDLASTLEASAGEVKYAGFVHYYKVRSDDFDAYFHCDPTLSFNAGTTPLSVVANGSSIDVRWAGSQSSRFSRVIHWDTGDEWDYGDLNHEHDFLVRFDTRIDAETGVVSFVRSPDSRFDLDITGHEWLADLGGEDRSLINDKIDAYFRPRLQAFMQSLSTPEIDTFLVRNLLFPGHNALRPSDAYVPGDMALFGYIDPLRTACKVTPLQPTVEAGGTQQFKTEPAMTGVTWSVRATDDEDLNVGTIDAKGLYKAAPASELVQGYQRVVVTAKGKHEGQDVTSSAMVSVVETTVSVAPLFQVCGEGQTITLTAETLSGKDPEWSLKTRSRAASSASPRAASASTPHLRSPIRTARPPTWKSCR